MLLSRKDLHNILVRQGFLFFNPILLHKFGVMPKHRENVEVIFVIEELMSILKEHNKG
jgi:hypothetical protein